MRINSQFPFWFFDRVESTQSEAMRRLEAGNRVPFWVLATEQTKGRGRSGRNWQSAQGNYAASFVLPMPRKRQDTPKFSPIVALGLARALGALGIRDVAIKWPNDVLVDGKKIAGILIEVEQDHMVIGMGVNLIKGPDERALEARALPAIALQGVVDIDFASFHEILEANLLASLKEFEDFGFESIRNALKNQLFVRENMVLDNGREEVLVRAIDLGAHGQLIVDVAGERREIYAGDLWIVEEDGSRN